MEKNIRQLIEPSMKTLTALLSRNLPPDTTQAQLEAVIDQEIFNFEYRFALHPEFLECEDISIQNAFRKTIMQNLSFDEDFGLIWMMPRNTKIGQVTKKMLECNKTVNGRISLLKMTGSLLDVDTSGIEFDSVTGLVKKVTIKLICPKYDTTGHVIGESEKEFSYTRENWRTWQKAGHKLASSQSKPGSMETLNLANESYWNFMPKPAKKDSIASAETASGTNPTSGINPSFAITKCTLHALNDAKLERNPYAKRFVYVNHKRYVEDIPMDEFEEPWKASVVEKDVPDFPSDNLQVLNEMVEEGIKEANKQVEAIVKELDEVSEVVNLPKGDDIIKEAELCNTSDEVMSVYHKYKDFLDENDKYKKKLGDIGKDRRTNPRVAEIKSEETTSEKIERAENIIDNISLKVESENITSDDL